MLLQPPILFSITIYKPQSGFWAKLDFDRTDVRYLSSRGTDRKISSPLLFFPFKTFVGLEISLLNETARFVLHFFFFSFFYVPSIFFNLELFRAEKPYWA